MRGAARATAAVATVLAVAAATAGCQWDGVNSLPLPGTSGHGAGSFQVTVEMPDVSSITQNSPVMVDDVTVGSVSKIQTEGWHAKLTVTLGPGVDLPADAVATIGQTSLLGSQHLELAPPTDAPARGRLSAGSVIPLARAGAYPTTEQTLSALAVVLDGGGLGQVQTITTELNNAFGGNDRQIRDLLTQIDQLAGTLDRQRTAVVATIDNLHRFAGEVAGENDTLTRALDTMPTALQTLDDERSDFTRAMRALTGFSDTGTQLVHATRSDLEKNLTSLRTTLTQVAATGDSLINNLGTITTFPFPQVTIDNAMRGDYTNLWAVLDLTVPRLRAGLAYGTPLGTPAPGATPAAAPAGPTAPTGTPVDPLLAPLHTGGAR
ncbi:MCE family protein [Speluncibacter jeojiensis]|uniref:MCE family protein n=1 Tax=Speluncibacter jeojiensis TaxID=2710754 RepID=A0A9X4M6F4_9ACTN|nr:MCE family protein [Corynebacteriales bacterium D3-21]